MNAASDILGLNRIDEFMGWVYLIYLEAVLYKFSILGIETNNTTNNNSYIVLILCKTLF